MTPAATALPEQAATKLTPTQEEIRSWRSEDYWKHEREKREAVGAGALNDSFVLIVKDLREARASRQQARLERRNEMSKSATQVINEYIQLLTTGHVKGLGRELSKEETELCVSLLQAVAADIEFSAPAASKPEASD